MRKMIMNSTRLKDFFTFSRSEQRGIFVLLSLITLVSVAARIYPVLASEQEFNPENAEKEIMEFERMIALSESLQKRPEKGGRFSGFYSSAKDSAGKHFAEDDFVIELNVADTIDLQRLRGIGPGFARRIVKYREKLGGFISVEQVREVFGMEPERFESIRRHLTVEPDSVRKIPINTAGVKELMKHPYFTFGVTKCIMVYRRDHKVIGSPEELKNVPGISDSVFRKILPYVRVD